MKDRFLESVVDYREREPIPLYSLIPHRVRNVLLVSSLYDFYTFEEDGRLTESLFSEYLELNLRYAPRIHRVSTAAEALVRLRRENFDLVISMLRVGSMDIMEFGKAVKNQAPTIPVILLAYNTRELQHFETLGPENGIDRVFVWLGDVRLFLAIIKYVEDRMNALHDARLAGVKSIILIEDSVRFYSLYLPMLYTEVVKQTQSLMADGVNRLQKIIRMRARPKILLATTYEEGLDLYERYHDHLLGVITDASFPRNGVLDKTAGLDFAQMVKSEPMDPPVLMQSSNEEHAKFAESIRARFIDKDSKTLLNDVREFIRTDLGFGDFIFKTPDGVPITSASNLNDMTEALNSVPVESVVYHATRNDFSTWLMARTEFDLARKLRPRTIDEFESPEAARQYLLTAINRHLESERAGLVADFSSGSFDAVSTFLRIGSGSLGGKGRGLAFFNSLLNSYKIDEHIPGVKIFVPPSAVVATDIFDQFMAKNDLWSVALKQTDDTEIARAFLRADFPDEALDLLGVFIDRVGYPVAVRSSSLLEDVAHQPFAGIYNTYLLPNNHKKISVRIKELCNAIKLVYASSFFIDSRRYIEATPNRLEDIKMAAIIQELVGKQHDHYLYPDISGVARSYDHYPMEGISPDDGVAMVAIGLGRTVVEGGKCVRFSPAYPRRLYQFSKTQDYLDNAQREFFALDLSVPGPDWKDLTGNTSNYAKLGLDAAEKHGTLYVTGSTYDAQNETVYDGISRQGVRLVTLAGILKSKVYPLDEILTFLLDIGKAGFSCPVEIEFAGNISRNPEEPHEMGFLQIRPLVIPGEMKDFDLDKFDREDILCFSDKAIGYGHVEEIKDIVYVNQKIDSLKTHDIASEIDNINIKLLADESRPFLLIGPGRWGTSDRFYGIPVSWAQISGVRCIVETDIEGVNVEPSQGTHFFHNITSFGIGYFTVHSDSRGCWLDHDWITNQDAEYESKFVRWIKFDEPLKVIVDGKKHKGIVLKPGVPLNHA
jgi:hypothetical protein